MVGALGVTVADAAVVVGEGAVAGAGAGTRVEVVDGRACRELTDGRAW